MHNNNSGFTYIELMIVIFIAGIVTAVSLPVLKGSLNSYELDSSAETIASKIREIRETAITEEDANYRIKFYVDPSGETAVDKYCKFYGANRQEVYELPAGVNINNASFVSPVNKKDNALWFNAYGCPAKGFGGTVELENLRGENVYIIVAKTGRVRISNTPPESGY